MTRKGGILHALLICVRRQATRDKTNRETISHRSSVCLVPGALGDGPGRDKTNRVSRKERKFGIFHKKEFRGARGDGGRKGGTLSEKPKAHTAGRNKLARAEL